MTVLQREEQERMLRASHTAVRHSAIAVAAGAAKLARSRALVVTSRTRLGVS